MNKIQKRTLYFLVGCVGLRILLSIALQNVSNSLAPYVSILPLSIGAGFAAIWAFGLRQKKGSFDNEIWWNPLRIVHALLYLLTSWFLYTRKQELASTIVLIDTGIGILSYFWHYYNTEQLVKIWED